MPAKLRISKQREKITPEAIRLFRRGCAIIKCGDHEFYEEDGGRKSEYLEISRRLDWGLLGCAGDDGSLDVEEAEQAGKRYEDQAGEVSQSTRASMPRARELHTQLKKGTRR